MIDILTQPWPWYVVGPIISFVMFFLLLIGNRFGISSNLKTVCSMMGAGKKWSYFKFNWKEYSWNLIFIIGTIVGGYIAHEFMHDGKSIRISEKTITELQHFGIAQPGKEIAPKQIFSWSALLTNPSSFIMIILGGFLVGFGTRYAEGCTSGHAISGLSNLQIPSLIAVVGFFIGGLIATHLLIPLLL